MSEVTPGRKPGRPRKAPASPATEPVEASNDDSGPDVPAAVTITVEELVDGMDQNLVLRMYRHLTGGQHKLTPGEARVELGYGVPGRDADMDAEWERLMS